MYRTPLWRSPVCRWLCLMLLVCGFLAGPARGAEEFSAFALGYYSYRNTQITVWHEEMSIGLLPVVVGNVHKITTHGYAMFDLGGLNVANGRSISSGNLVVTGRGADS